MNIKTLPLDTKIADNGRVYISRKSLAIMLNVTTQQIINYEKPQRYKEPLLQAFKEGRQVYYELMYSFRWYDRNVDLKSSPKKESSYVKDSFNEDSDISEEDEEYYNEFIQALPKELQIAFKKSSLDELEKFAKLEDIAKKAFDNKIKRGEYISKDDVDRATLEMVTMLKEAMKQIEDGLPRELLLELVFIDNSSSKIVEILEPLVIRIKKLDNKIIKWLLSPIVKVVEIAKEMQTKKLLNKIEKSINRYFINIMRELNNKASEVEPSE